MAGLSTLRTVRPVMRMISTAKGITLVVKTARSHKTGIVPAAVVTGSVIESLIDIESSTNRFGDHALAVHDQHQSSGRIKNHEVHSSNFVTPAAFHNIKQI